MSPTRQQTVEYISSAVTWDQRVARMREIPERHGTADLPLIHAEIARQLYVPHLSPDYAYVYPTVFHSREHFQQAYRLAVEGTDYFTRVGVETLTTLIQEHPVTLLVFRTITGLLKEEFAHSTKLVAAALDLPPLSGGKVDGMEKNGSATSEEQARVAAETLSQIMAGALFPEPPGEWVSKQNKPDTEHGWETVQRFSENGVPYSLFLHQRHYGGAYRQQLDATSEKRGDLIEDAVEALFQENGIPYIRTGSHNQGDIQARFGIRVAPAPDFVVFDRSDTLRAMLECKGANDGGTARDKALRFARLRDESTRLGGVPLIAVLGGIGWARVNDTLGPVVRDTDGRVFTAGNLSEMLTVSPFPQLLGTAE